MTDTEEKRPPEIPQHTLLRRIGTGSYGEVWLARSVTGARRAVKIVRRDRFESEVPYEREFEGVRRFEEVSRGHPGLVDLFLVGRDDAAGFFYYVMALAADASGADDFEVDEYEPHTLGTDLKSRGRLPVETCLEMGQSVAEALHELHTHGLVHRDVKPSNLVFINGQYCLADIGMVTVANDPEAFVGTHGYLPREGAGQPAADVFALGRVLYEAMTGEDRQSFPVLPEAMHEGEMPLALSELNQVVLKACAHEPADRYGSAADLAADLAAIAKGGKAARARAGAGWKWAAAAALALGLGWVFWPGPAPVPERDAALVVHWRFDGGLMDASGANNPAQAKWTRAVEDRHGRPGKALGLTADSEVTATVPMAWAPRQPRSGALWFRVDGWQEIDPGWFQELASRQGVSLLNRLGFALQLKSNGLVGLDGNYLCALFRAKPFATNQWHHLAVTSAGTTGSARVWLDGAELNRVEAEGRFWWKPDKPWRAVKADEQGRLQFHAFTGAIDEVRLYRRALASAEVKAVYESERPAQPTLAAENWDANFSWAQLDPKTSPHLQAREHLRRVEETGEGRGVYWSPETGVGRARLVYEFEFDRVVRRAHLRLPVYCVDLTPARAEPVRGAVAVEVSGDGRTWVAIYNGLEPAPKWGEGCGAGFIESDLPRAALGGRKIFLRVRLRAEGGTEDFSAAQLGRAPNPAGEDWLQAPVLRVKLQSP